MNSPRPDTTVPQQRFCLSLVDRFVRYHRRDVVLQSLVWYSFQRKNTVEQSLELNLARK